MNENVYVDTMCRCMQFPIIVIIIDFVLGLEIGMSL